MSTTTAADRDTGERRALADDMADRLLWWIQGPFGSMPASVAALPAEERAAVWAHIDGLARRKGPDFVRGLAESLTLRKPTNPATAVNDPAGSGDE